MLFFVYNNINYMKEVIYMNFNELEKLLNCYQKEIDELWRSL